MNQRTIVRHLTILSSTQDVAGTPKKDPLAFGRPA